MKKPKWLEKEKLYSIMFESDVPMGRAEYHHLVY